MRIHTIIFFLSILVVMTIPTLGQDASYPTVLNYYEPWAEPPEHALDMQHMRLEVSFVPEQGLVKGRVTHVFTPIRSQVDSFFFNGPGIRILKATLNNRSLHYRVSAEGITTYFDPPLSWDEQDSISFVYEASPHRGLYFVGWNDPGNLHRKQIWTQGQGIDNRHWIPCYDEQNDKLTTETIITFNRDYEVLSNGTKVSEKDNGDGTKTWHYVMSHPQSSYLVMLGIGKYKSKTIQSKSGVPMHLWYYPEYPERVEPTYTRSAEAMDFMGRETGVPYPWESYSEIPVSDFLYGGMENTTATVFGDTYLVDQRESLDQSYLAVNVHELAHQWFGDYVTARSGRSAWLQESFATFYTTLFQRSIFGEEYYEWAKRTEQNTALAASEQNRLPILHSHAGSARAYQKGSAVLDMMTYTFGTEEFKRVIHHYLLHHAYGNVETNDLYQAFQDVLGESPFWFFEEWIYRGGEPEYTVDYEDVIEPGAMSRRTEITISQTHAVDALVKLFRMPIVCEVHYSDGTSDRAKTMIEQQTERVVIANPGNRKISFVLFDPGSAILKKVIFKKSLEELEAQALRAPHMIDRYDAVVAMRPEDLTTKREVLLRVYAKETFHAIRTEIISQLIDDHDAKSRELIRAAFNDRDVRVRAAVVNQSDSIHAEFQSQYESSLNDSSLNIIAAALRKLSTRFPEKTSQYLAITKGLTGIGNQVRILWHELNASLGSSASIDSLVAYSGMSYEYHTRVNALEALKRLNIVTDQLLPNLFDAMLHFNNRLRGPATAVGTYFCEQTLLKNKIQAYYMSRTWEPWQREILKPIIH